MFLALGIQNVMRMRYIVIWDLFDSAGFFHVMSYAKELKKKNIEYKYSFRFSLQSLTETFLIVRALSEI